MFSTLNSLDSVTVCVTVIDKFEKTLKDEDRKDGPKLEKLFMKFCKDLRGKEERFVSTYRIFSANRPDIKNFTILFLNNASSIAMVQSPYTALLT